MKYFKESMEDRVRPIHALCFFTVSLLGNINQLIVFDYYDPDKYYASLIERELIDEELEAIASKMQDYLDEEKVLINGKRVYPELRYIDLAFRGSLKRPSLYFIIHFKGDFKTGINVYEDYYDREIAEYDYEFYWIFPPGVVIKDIIVDGIYSRIGDNILAVYVDKGTEISGFEKIVFEIPDYLAEHIRKTTNKFEVKTFSNN